MPRSVDPRSVAGNAAAELHRQALVPFGVHREDHQPNERPPTAESPDKRQVKREWLEKQQSGSTARPQSRSLAQAVQCACVHPAVVWHTTETNIHRELIEIYYATPLYHVIIIPATSHEYRRRRRCRGDRKPSLVFTTPE